MKANKPAIIERLRATQAIPTLIKTVIERHGLSCDVEAVTAEILEWPAIDHRDLMTDSGLADTAIQSVAERHRIWRPGEAVRR